MKNVTLNFDGACIGGNPGGSAVGSWLAYDQKNELLGSGAKEVAKGPGATNNVAEYGGLILGLKWLMENGHTGRVFIRGDSQLVIRQIQGSYQVRNERLKILHAEVMNLLSHFGEWVATHVKRQFNQEADELGKNKFKEMNS
jgi:ribonuclease HI